MLPFGHIFVCLFVSRVGWIPGVAQVSPWLDRHVCICRNPQSREFPLHHYSDLGTRTMDLSSFQTIEVDDYSRVPNKTVGNPVVKCSEYNSFILGCVNDILVQ